MTWRRAGLGLLMALVLAGSTGAWAQGAPEIDLQVMVSRISDGPGGIDARGKRLHEKLAREFRYESLKVLDSHRLGLAVDETGQVKLPNGRTLRVRPIQLGDRGVLLAVEVKGLLQTDLRVQNGHLVVIGAGRDGDGKLVISFEPRW